MPFDPILLLVLALAGAVAFAIAAAVMRRRLGRVTLATDDPVQITAWENEGGNLPSPVTATPSLHRNPKAPS